MRPRRYMDALQYYDEALSIRRFALGEQHLDVAPTPATHAILTGLKAGESIRNSI